MTTCEELLTEIRANIALDRQHKADMLASNNRIEASLEMLLYHSKNVTEKYLVSSGNLITKGDYYEIPGVDSDGYERARIFCSIAFNENTSAGISFDLYYAGHRIGEVLEVSPTNAGMSAGSEAFDINQLSGFNLVAINHDPAQEVKINSLKIVLYNE